MVPRLARIRSFPDHSELRVFSQNLLEATAKDRMVFDDQYFSHCSYLMGRPLERRMRKAIENLPSIRTLLTQTLPRPYGSCSLLRFLCSLLLRGTNLDSDRSSPAVVGFYFYIAAKSVRPLPHTQKPKRCRTGNLFFGHALAVIVNFEQNITVLSVKSDFNFRRFGVARHVRQAFLENTKQRGRRIPKQLYLVGL